MPLNTPENGARRDWLGCLARAPEGRAAQLLALAGLAPEFEYLRPPEIGSVMLRGRMGGSGGPFNLGEMTVTRCSLKLASGEVGHGYVQGRRRDDAQAAALVDALMQTGMAARIRRDVLDPLSADEQTRRTARAGKAAQTKVEFFTMVRGED
ncbi:phosphonate C-P lyase system protein PhnG [Paracoccus onubensis]|uniref:Phosphonate C-P lyase system protein PhnG n=1 Tax=Paracoccus onubensis TaxID=1675788 RepID=A0A418SMY6_9RHOB|nr:phosphonate C-P lyase system protein PhnG [Paracoccus onubensis]RJE82308.1 phosphonate C-P lyase system protein PhnG [Paracoccus onubensis]